MSKGETFKLILIGIIFSFSLLVALPLIPIDVDSKIFSTHSQLGGYEIKIPSKSGEKVLDLSDYKKGLGVGESQKVLFKVEESDISQEKIDAVLEVIQNRLKISGMSGIQIGVQEKGEFFVVIPEFQSPERVSGLVIGSGNVDFKKVKTPSDWSNDKISDFYLDPEKWESTGVGLSDMQGFRYYVSPNGATGLQMVFTPEGRKKFYAVASENIGLPIAIYVNDSQYPILMPVISEDILTNTNSDPAITGTFSEQAVSDINLQIENPLSVKVSYLETSVMEPTLGYDFLSSYLYAISIGLVLISVVFVLRFNALGLLETLSLVVSLLLLLALSKIVPLTISTEFFVGIILITGIMTIIGYVIFRDLKQGVRSGKPFDYVYYEIFGKEKDMFSIPSMFIFLLSISLMVLTSGTLKSLMSFISVGSLVLIVYYSFILPTLMGAFGGHKK